MVTTSKGVTIDNGLLDVWNLRGHAADVSRLLSPISQKAGRAKYVLIILDPVYKLLGSRDENKAGDIATLLNEIERLAVTSGASVVFGAHFSKGNQAGKEAIDRIGGSGVFARDPDSILIFTRHEEPNAFTVDATLRNHPPISDFVVRWDFPLMRIADDLDPSKLKKQGVGRSKEFHTKDMLKLLVEPTSAGQWLELADEELGMSRSTFNRLRRELAREKAAVKNSEGKWQRA
jgi:hypothetical protein